MQDRKYEKAVTLLEAELADEIVALDRAKGECFGFNPVASDVWRMLDQPRSVSELSGRLTELYEVGDEQCQGEVTALLDAMAGLGLVREFNSGGAKS